MICHCGRKMSLVRDDVLKVSGMRRQMFRCNSRHSFTLLEGVPVTGRRKEGSRCECASNANAANSEANQRWQNRVSRDATRTRHTEAEPFSLRTPATVLNLQAWGLQMHVEHGLPKKGAEALTTMRNSSAGSSFEDSHHHAIAVADNGQAARP